MARILALRQFARRANPTRESRLSTGVRLEILYVGVGDQFDDDRRLVRDRARPLHPDEPSEGLRRRKRSETL